LIVRARQIRSGDHGGTTIARVWFHGKEGTNAGRFAFLRSRLLLAKLLLNQIRYLSGLQLASFLVPVRLS